tara:strand:- start:858 stop:1043 length:186 start_codon:yes stop_codon:yes gene_type:complete
MAKIKPVKLKMETLVITYEEGQRLKAIRDNKSADLGISLSLEQTAEMMMRTAIRESSLPKS